MSGRCVYDQSAFMGRRRHRFYLFGYIPRRRDGFLFQKNIGGKLQRISLGFAAGVMIAASVWSLLIPHREAEARGEIGWIPAAGGFVLEYSLPVCS